MTENIWQKLKREHKPFMALAPLDGVTDYVFREIVAQTAKPDILFTEFTSTDGLFSAGHQKTAARFIYSKQQRPIVAQIWGTRPENFFKAAQFLAERDFDGIDINMGCPDRTVMKLGSGSALIKNTTLVAEIISATKEGAGKLPLSIKTRIGVKTIATESWATFLLEQKIDALTIHGRTAEELSKVPAHWDEIAKVVAIKNVVAPNTVILGNGDITNIKEAEVAHNMYGVDGIMIGRGIFTNPWVFDRAKKEHSVKEHLDLLLKHTKLYVDIYGDMGHFDTLKKFFKIYVNSFPGAKELKVQLMDTKNYEQVENLIAKWRIKELTC